MKKIDCFYHGIISVPDDFDCDYCDECDFCTDKWEEEEEEDD